MSYIESVFRAGSDPFCHLCTFAVDMYKFCSMVMLKRKFLELSVLNCLRNNIILCYVAMIFTSTLYTLNVFIQTK